MLGLIWAQSADGWIGRDGTMPWHVPEDLRHFKETTMNSPVVMGRRTWESLNPQFRPLPGRRNIVLTRNPLWHADGAETASSLEVACELVSSASSSEPLGHDDAPLWVIGGGEIYRMSLPIADRCVVTELDLTVPDGDTKAPRLDRTEWDRVSASEWAQSVCGIRYRFMTYQRLSR